MDKKEQTKLRMRRMRERNKDSVTNGMPSAENVTLDVTLLDPTDWRDRRNYSAVYLRCLEAQGGELTEKSQVAMIGAVPPNLVEFRRKYGHRPFKVFTPSKSRVTLQELRDVVKDMEHVGV